MQVIRNKILQCLYDYSNNDEKLITGLYNSAYFDKSVVREAGRAKRYDTKNSHGHVLLKAITDRCNCFDGQSAAQAAGAHSHRRCGGKVRLSAC